MVTLSISILPNSQLQLFHWHAPFMVNAYHPSPTRSNRTHLNPAYIRRGLFCPGLGTRRHMHMHAGPVPGASGLVVLTGVELSRGIGCHVAVAAGHLRVDVVQDSEEERRRAEGGRTGSVDATRRFDWGVDASIDPAARPAVDAYLPPFQFVGTCNQNHLQLSDVGPGCSVLEDERTGVANTVRLLLRR
ncbi:hypothetical protein DENSPDRAFT_593840 [Dentipellis sp. KUC8613]|nr:hypothetical protein DENSPDRAFT_593840 [Dentipellis sp. KUC8613]